MQYTQIEVMIFQFEMTNVVFDLKSQSLYFNIEYDCIQSTVHNTMYCIVLLVLVNELFVVVTKLL